MSSGTRFAFLSFQVDTALPVFYGASQPDVADWLRQYERSFTELWNTRSFVAAGTGHVVLAGRDRRRDEGGVVGMAHAHGDRQSRLGRRG